MKFRSCRLAESALRATSVDPALPALAAVFVGTVPWGVLVTSIVALCESTWRQSDFLALTQQLKMRCTTSRGNKSRQRYRLHVKHRVHVAFFADMTNQDRIHWLNIDHVAAPDSSFREILAKTEVLDLDPSLPTGAELVRFRKQSAAVLRALFDYQLSKGGV